MSVFLSLQTPVACEVGSALRFREQYRRVQLDDDATDADVRKALTCLLRDYRKDGDATIVEVEKRMFAKGRTFAKATG